MSVWCPSTSGQAECMVHTTKDYLWWKVQGDWHYRQTKFLLAQHTMLFTFMGCSPVKLLMDQRLTTFLDYLHPNNSLDQHPSIDAREAPRGFFPRDVVYSQNHRSGPAWVPKRWGLQSAHLEGGDSQNPFQQRFIKFWKIPGTTLTPNCSRLTWKAPMCVMMIWVSAVASATSSYW